MTAKKIFSFIGGVLVGIAIVSVIKGVYEHTALERDYKENHIYGRLNAEKQTVYVTGTLHNEPVKMTVMLENTTTQSLAQTGLMDGSIGDEHISYSFVVGDTEEGDIICERHGLYYKVPTYDDKWFNDLLDKTLNQQFIGACGGDSDHSTWLTGLPMQNDDSPVSAWCFKPYVTSEELEKEFPEVHAFLSDEDLQERIDVEVYTEYDRKKNDIKDKVLLVALKVEPPYGEEEPKEGVTELQFAFR